MEEKSGIKFEDLTEAAYDAEKKDVITHDECLQYVEETAKTEAEKDDNDAEGSTFVDVRLLRLQGVLRLYELDKITLEIKQARIVAKKLKDGTILNMAEIKPTCRYTAAKNQHKAEQKFIEMVTGKKYSVWKREQKAK